MVSKGSKGLFYLTIEGQWDKCEKDLGMLSTKLNFFIKMFLRTEGEYLKQKMQGMIDTGRREWKPLSKWTKAIRRFKGIGHNKPLNETGELKNSIEVKENYLSMGAYSSSVFIGVLNKKRMFSNGKSILEIARIHEFGVKPYAIAPTHRMLKFLFFIGHKYGIIKDSRKSSNSSGVIFISIPARPYVEPTFDEYKAESNARLQGFFKSIKGFF